MKSHYSILSIKLKYIFIYLYNKYYIPLSSFKNYKYNIYIELLFYHLYYVLKIFSRSYSYSVTNFFDIFYVTLKTA